MADLMGNIVIPMRMTTHSPAPAPGATAHAASVPADTADKRTQQDVLTAVEAPMVEHDLLTPSEVAVMFRVNAKTVTRWARAGKISAVRTLGGHRRYRASEIRRILEETTQELTV
jgi:excisionase family DNA binding protein